MITNTVGQQSLTYSSY